MGNFVEAKLVILLSLTGSGASSSLDPRLPATEAFLFASIEHYFMMYTNLSDLLCNRSMICPPQCHHCDGGVCFIHTGHLTSHGLNCSSSDLWSKLLFRVEKV